MILPVFLPHLGCGARCIYCNQNLITHGQTEPIHERLERLLGGVGPRAEVGLYGGNPLGLQFDDLARLLQEFVPYESRIRNIRLSTKPRLIGEDVIALLRKHRVTTIELGMPCFNDKVLAQIRRGHTVDEFLASYEQLTSEGFVVGLQVMVGLPGETKGDVETTASEILRLKPSFVRIYPLVVIEGTPLAAMYGSGAFTPLTLDEAVDRVLLIYLDCWNHMIPIIKMGLTDNDVIRRKILAGPYHPAFGYLVKSRAFYRALLARAREARMLGDITVTLNPSDVAHLTGYRRSQIKALDEAGLTVRWQGGDVTSGHFLLANGRLSVEGSVRDARPTPRF